MSAPTLHGAAPACGAPPSPCPSRGLPRAARQGLRPAPTPAHAFPPTCTTRSSSLQPPLAATPRQQGGGTLCAIRGTKPASGLPLPASVHPQVGHPNKPYLYLARVHPMAVRIKSPWHSFRSQPLLSPARTLATVRILDGEIGGPPPSAPTPTTLPSQLPHVTWVRWQQTRGSPPPPPNARQAGSGTHQLMTIMIMSWTTTC